MKNAFWRAIEDDGDRSQVHTVIDFDDLSEGLLHMP